MPPLAEYSQLQHRNMLCSGLVKAENVVWLTEVGPHWTLLGKKVE